MPRHTTESPAGSTGLHTQQQTSPSVVKGSTKSATGHQHPTLLTLEAHQRVPDRPNPSAVRPIRQPQVVGCSSNAPVTPYQSLTLPTRTATPSCGKSPRPTRSRSSSLESLFSDEKEPASPTTHVSPLAPVVRDPAPIVLVTKPAPTTGPTLALPSGPPTMNPFLSTAGPATLGAHRPVKAPTPPSLTPAIPAAGPPPQPQYRWVFAPRGRDASEFPIPAPPEELAATFAQAAFALPPFPGGLRLPKAGAAKQLPLGAPSPRAIPPSRMSGGVLKAGYLQGAASSSATEAAAHPRASAATRNTSSAKTTPPTASGLSAEPLAPKAPVKARDVAGRSGPKADSKKTAQAASGTTAASGTSGKRTEPVPIPASKIETQNKYVRAIIPGLSKYSWQTEGPTSGQMSTTAAKTTTVAKKKSPAAADSNGNEAVTAKQVEDAQASSSTPSSSTAKPTALARKRARKQKDNHDAGNAEAGPSKRAKRGKE